MPVLSQPDLERPPLIAQNRFPNLDEVGMGQVRGHLPLGLPLGFSLSSLGAMDLRSPCARGLAGSADCWSGRDNRLDATRQSNVPQSRVRLARVQIAHWQIASEQFARGAASNPSNQWASSQLTHNVFAALVGWSGHFSEAFSETVVSRQDLDRQGWDRQGWGDSSLRDNLSRSFNRPFFWRVSGQIWGRDVLMAFLPAWTTLWRASVGSLFTRGAHSLAGSVPTILAMPVPGLGQGQFAQAMGMDAAGPGGAGMGVASQNGAGINRVSWEGVASGAPAMRSVMTTTMATTVTAIRAPTSPLVNHSSGGQDAALGAALCPLSSALSPDGGTLAGAQVRVGQTVIAAVPTLAMAQRLVQQIEAAQRSPDFDAAQIQPGRLAGIPVVKMGDRPLLAITPELALDWTCNADALVIQWSNQLRLALGAEPLDLAAAQAALYDLQESGDRLSFKASWYGPYFHGRQTATGEIFNQNDFTAAHPSLPFDTYLKVTNPRTGKSVIVRINDRGPYVGDRNLDLSHEAARALGSEGDGVVSLDAVIMQSNSILTKGAIARL